MNKRRISLTVVGLTLARLVVHGLRQVPASAGRGPFGMDDRYEPVQPRRAVAGPDEHGYQEGRGEPSGNQGRLQGCPERHAQAEAQVEEFISAGVDVIIVSPKEAAPLTPRSPRLTRRVFRSSFWIAGSSATSTPALSAPTTKGSGRPPANGLSKNSAEQAKSSN